MFARSVAPLVLTVLMLPSCTGREASSVPGGMEEPYYDLGGFHRKVTTGSAEAQRWFDRGLALSIGFNHEEAVRCFERAIAADPDCAMAHWGIAYALGPNINNLEMDVPATERAAAAAASAGAASQASELERKLIEAVSTRYVLPPPEDRHPLNVAYADAMREILQDHPDDAEVAALTAEAVMILRPWKHWTPEGEPAPETPEIVEILEAGLRSWPDHPALCHLYIHAMEASPNPEIALPAANRLRDRMPGAGHLVHMPSHIDVLVGDYEMTIEANRKAIVADEEFERRQGAHNFYTLYRVHNYHFLVYGAMFDGQSELALKTARELVTEIPEEMLLEWTDFLDAFVPTPLHVLVRFGRWEDILSEPEPPAHLPVTRAIWHYARGLAYAATNRPEEAADERPGFRKAYDDVPETSILFNNSSRDILGVAEAMLDGEIEYRNGRFDEAFEHLELAVRRDDALNYDEPWGWMQPARHALGALLLEQGQVERAEAVYREDLRRHPKNPWALHGLAECLRLSDRGEAALETVALFEEASARTDVVIQASCYCRGVTP